RHRHVPLGGDRRARAPAARRSARAREGLRLDRVRDPSALRRAPGGVSRKGARMNGLLQRLAGQALGVSGPRVRSAATVYAQIPMAVPAGGLRDAGNGASALASAPSPTTLAPTPAAPRDPGAGSGREPADTVAGPHTHQVESRQRIDEATTQHIDVDTRWM